MSANYSVKSKKSQSIPKVEKEKETKVIPLVRESQNYKHLINENHKQEDRDSHKHHKGSHNNNHQERGRSSNKSRHFEDEKSVRLKSTPTRWRASGKMEKDEVNKTAFVPPATSARTFLPRKSRLSVKGFPKPWGNIRFHYHYKDGSRRDYPDPDDSDCETVYSCETLHNLRQRDIENYKEEQKETVRKHLIERRKAAILERDIQRKRELRREELLAQRQLQKRKEKVNMIVNQFKKIKDYVPEPELDTPEVRKQKSIEALIEAFKGVSSNEISRTSIATMFQGPLAEGLPIGLRLLKQTDKVFFRHKYCKWSSKLERNEENNYQILNNNGHKLLDICEENKSKSCWGSRETIEYSCYDESHQNIVRIIKKFKRWHSIRMEVFSPPTHLIGSIKYKIHFLATPRLVVREADGRTYAFITPKILKQAHIGKKQIFSIKTYGGSSRGVIRPDWDDLHDKLKTKNTHYGVRFIGGVNIVSKALILSASLLIYTHFYRGKVKRKKISRNVALESRYDNLGKKYRNEAPVKVTESMIRPKFSLDEDSKVIHTGSFFQRAITNSESEENI